MSEIKTHVEHHDIIEMEHSSGSSAMAAAPICNMPEHKRQPGNPICIGLAAFAIGAFILGLYNTGLIMHLPQAIVGVALGTAGMGQFIAGIGELLIGNTFGGTTMLTYAGFWFSFGIMFSSTTGFLTVAEAAGMHELEMCLGIWQIAFSVPSFIYFVATFKQSILMRLILLQVFLGFFLGGLGALTGVAGLTQAGGWITFTLSLSAWYVMAAIIFAEEKVAKLPVF